MAFSPTAQELSALCLPLNMPFWLSACAVVHAVFFVGLPGAPFSWLMGITWGRVSAPPIPASVNEPCAGSSPHAFVLRGKLSLGSFQ